MSVDLAQDHAWPGGVDRRGWIRRALAAVGAPVVALVLWIVRASALGWAVLWQALWPTTWRRPVRAEFKRAMRMAVLGGLPAVLLISALIGLGLVYQTLYWLESAGQVALIGRVLVAVLIRELAPLLVGFVLIGQSGIVTLLEISQMREGGQLRMLDGQGVDPFLFLVLPRTLAYMLATFTLTILFIVVAIFTGYAAASTLGYVKLPLVGFLDVVMRAMGIGDFALVPIKSLAVGFVVAIVACMTALTHAGEATRVVSRGFVRSALALLVTTGIVSLML